MSSVSCSDKVMSSLLDTLEMERKKHKMQEEVVQKKEIVQRKEVVQKKEVVVKKKEAVKKVEEVVEGDFDIDDFVKNNDILKQIHDLRMKVVKRRLKARSLTKQKMKGNTTSK